MQTREINEFRNNETPFNFLLSTSCRNPSTPSILHPSVSLAVHRGSNYYLGGTVVRVWLEMQRNLWPGTVIDSPRVGRGERVASEKKKRRAGRKGRKKRAATTTAAGALLGRTPTGLFQYYARWQVSLCPEWHVISVTSSRFDQVIEFSFSTWPRKIGCRDTPTIPRLGPPVFDPPLTTLAARERIINFTFAERKSVARVYIPTTFPPWIFPLFDLPRGTIDAGSIRNLQELKECNKD